MRTFQISLFKNKLDNNARIVERTWSQLSENFQRPTIRFEKDGPLFSPAVFDPPKRAKRNAKRLSLLVLDLDHAAKLGTIKSGLYQLRSAYIISSTHSHLRKTESNPNAEPRFRVVIPLAEPIPAASFLSLWNYVKNKTGLNVDEAAKDESRIFYTPSIANAESEYECCIEEAPFLDWKSLPLRESVSNATALRANQAFEPAAPFTPIANGSRNQGLFRLGKQLVQANLSPDAIRAALMVENARLCDTPLPASEVETIAANVLKYPINLSEPTEDSGLPIPLPENTLHTPELDERWLPEAWAPWLSDISDRLQCPLDYATVAALVSAASLIGNRIRIRPKRHDSWMVVPNFWGAIVGPPGVMKTPAVAEGLFFFKAIAERESGKYKKEIEEAGFDRLANEVQKSLLIKEMKKGRPENLSDLKTRYQTLIAEEPVEKRLWTADSTVEKIGVLLNENPDGILIFRDELTGWLKKLDKPGHEQDRAFYLEAWNGEGSFTFDRIGRGKTHIKNLTLSVLGTIQPAMLESYIRGSVEGWGNDGLIQRFQILVYPEASKNYQYKDQPPKDRELVKESFERLYSMTPKDVDAKFLTLETGGHAFLQFDDKAQEFFQKWLTDLETYLRSGQIQNAAIESHLSKYRSLMPSLALIFHLMQRVTNRSESSQIELTTAHLAAAWCSYLQKHAEKLYRTAILSEFDTAREILGRIDSGELTSPFSARDIYSKHWRRLSDPKDVNKALEILTEYRHLNAMAHQTGGRTKTIYLINRV